MKRWIAVLLALVISGSALWAVLRPQLQHGIGVTQQSAGAEKAYYFRLKSSYLYKGTPLNFDIVAGCSARITHWIDRDRTVEVGLVPFAYGLKMADGKGVVIKVPDVCQARQTTSSGLVPPDFLPFAAVYEDADRPMFGWLYATDDAYNSPLAELKFLGASIEKASPGDFKVWRETEASKNIIKPDMLDWTIGSLQGVGEGAHAWKPGKWYFGMYCRMMSRKPIPDDVRPRVRSLWLDPGALPEFWLPPLEPAHPKCGDCARNLAAVRQDIEYVSIGNNRTERRRNDWGPERETRSALHRAGDGGRIKNGRDDILEARSPEVYPWTSEFTANRFLLAVGHKAESVTASKVLFIPDRLGFGYCDSAITTTGSEHAWPTAPDYKQIYGPLTGGKSPPRKYQINELGLAGTDGTLDRIGGHGIFQTDEFIFKPAGIEFRDIFGAL